VRASRFGSVHKRLLFCKFNSSTCHHDTITPYQFSTSGVINQSSSLSFSLNHVGHVVLSYKLRKAKHSSCEIVSAGSKQTLTFPIPYKKSSKRILFDIFSVKLL